MLLQGPHLLPGHAVVHKGAFHNEQLGPIDIRIAIFLKQLTTGVPSESNLRDLQHANTNKLPLTSSDNPTGVIPLCKRQQVVHHRPGI